MTKIEVVIGNLVRLVGFAPSKLQKPSNVNNRGFHAGRFCEGSAGPRPESFFGPLGLPVLLLRRSEGSGPLVLEIFRQSSSSLTKKNNNLF